MKKKLEDLTIKEIKNIKRRCHNYMNCEECKEKDKICFMVCDINILALDDDYLKQEIEVD